MAVNGSSNEPSVGGNDLDNTGFNGEFSDGNISTTGIRDLPDSKYYDLYSYGDTYNDQIAYDRGKIGDLTRELNPVSDDIWNNDFARFVCSSWPIFVRGGDYNDGADSGLFDFVRGAGDVHIDDSFRPILVLF